MKTISLAENYGSLSQTINALAELGYTHDFNASPANAFWEQANQVLQPDNFQIDKVYRFETASNPQDQAILYAISAIKTGFKGTLVNGTGKTADPHTSKWVEELEAKIVHAIPKRKKRAKKASKMAEQFDFRAGLRGLDLPAAILQLKKEAKWVTGRLDAVTLFESDSFRIMLMGMQANAILQSHKAEGPISVQLLEGRINFITDTKQVVLEKEQILVLAAQETHNVIALEDSFFLLSIALEKVVAHKKRCLTKIAL
jgi:quercetin dioxygenase-like cupin family protein